jgi:hypothetical protein
MPKMPKHKEVFTMAPLAGQLSVKGGGLFNRATMVKV